MIYVNNNKIAKYCVTRFQEVQQWCTMSSLRVSLSMFLNLNFMLKSILFFSNIPIQFLLICTSSHVIYTYHSIFYVLKSWFSYILSESEEALLPGMFKHTRTWWEELSAEEYLIKILWYYSVMNPILCIVLNCGISVLYSLLFNALSTNDVSFIW